MGLAVTEKQPANSQRMAHNSQPPGETDSIIDNGKERVTGAAR
jgi:hypothetical protein